MRVFSFRRYANVQTIFKSEIIFINKKQQEIKNSAHPKDGLKKVQQLPLKPL